MPRPGGKGNGDVEGSLGNRCGPCARRRRRASSSWRAASRRRRKSPSASARPRRRTSPSCAADVGVAAGIFKKHGIDLEIANFGGDARLVQAMSANAIDFALGGGPTIAFEVKGAPMLAVAAMADRPRTIMMVVAKDGPVKTEDDLKGRTVSVSTTGSLTYWLAQELSRSHGWGSGRHQDRAARHHHGPGGRAQDPPGRRRGDRNRARSCAWSRKAPAASWCASATASRIFTFT